MASRTHLPTPGARGGPATAAAAPSPPAAGQRCGAAGLPLQGQGTAGADGAATARNGIAASRIKTKAFDRVRGCKCTGKNREVKSSPHLASVCWWQFPLGPKLNLWRMSNTWQEGTSLQLLHMPQSGGTETPGRQLGVLTCSAFCSRRGGIATAQDTDVLRLARLHACAHHADDLRNWG